MVMRGFSAVCSVEAPGLNLQRSYKSKLYFNPALIHLISMWRGGVWGVGGVFLGISIVSCTQKTERTYSRSSLIHISSDVAKFVSGQVTMFRMTVWGVFRLYERALVFSLLLCFMLQFGTWVNGEAFTAIPLTRSTFISKSRKNTIWVNDYIIPDRAIKQMKFSLSRLYSENATAPPPSNREVIFDITH